MASDIKAFFTQRPPIVLVTHHLKHIFCVMHHQMTPFLCDISTKVPLLQLGSIMHSQISFAKISYSTGTIYCLEVHKCTNLWLISAKYISYIFDHLTKDVARLFKMREW